MKNARHRSFSVAFGILAAIGLGFAGTGSLRAATLTYTDGPLVSGSITEGSGTWDTTTANWAQSGTNTVWDNNIADQTSAQIGAANAINGTGSTITIGNGITINVFNLLFNATTNKGWVLAAGNSSSSINLSGTLTQAGDNFGVTISAPINGVGSVVVDRALTLTGTNTYSGSTTINGGNLVAVDGIGLSASSNLIILSSALQMDGTFTRSLGTGAGQVELTGNSSTGGFTGNSSAGIVVNLGGNASTVTWGSTFFNPGTLQLGGNGSATFLNGIDLSGTNRTIQNSSNNSTSTVTVAGAIISSSGTAGVTFNNANGSSNATIFITGTDTYNGVTTVKGGGTKVILSGNGSINNTSGIVLSGAQLGVSESGTVTLAAPISGSGNGNGDTNSLAINGPGTVILAGSNSFTNGTIINGGSLVLSDTGSNTNKLSMTGTLTMNGGNLTLNGNASSSSSQQVGVTVIGAATTNTIVVNSNGQTATLNLGALSENSGGTVDFTLPASGAIQATATLDTYGLLGNWATVSGTAFATISGGNIVAYTPYNQNNVSLWLSGSNIGNTAGYFGTLASNLTIGTLAFSAAASPSTVTIGANQALTIGDGAILETAAVGANLQTITTGTLTSGTSSLQITQNNPSANLEIDSTIANGASALGLNKAGAGLVTLGGSNTYTGATKITGGTLAVTGILTSAASTTTVSSGATLQIGNGTTTGSLGGLTSVSGSGTVVYDSPGTVTLSAANFVTGALSLAQSGPGLLDFTASQNYTGGTIVNSGTLRFTTGGPYGGAAPSVPETITVNNGGTLLFNENDVFGNSAADPANLTLLINAGGLVTDNSNNNNLGPITLNGGTLQINGGNFQFAWSLRHTVTVTGTTESFMTAVNPTAANAFFFLSNGGVTFNVAHNTTGTDLLVSGILADGYAAGTQTVTTSSLTKSGSGIMLVTATNTYSGVTSVTGGTLATTVLANGGSNSGIGKSSNAATNLVLNGGTLQYLGVTGTSTDRLFSVGTSGGGLDASGSGALVLSNTSAMGFNSQTGARTLTLTGMNTGSNTLSAFIADNGGSTSLTKSGVGAWVVSSSNTYSGATTVTGGKLTLSGSNSYSGATTVTGGTLQIQNVYAMGSTSSLTLGGSGAALNTVFGSAPHTITLTTASGTTLTINNGSALTFGVGGGTADELVLAGSAGASVSGTSSVSLSILGSAPTAGIYTLISAPGGGLNGGTFAVGTINGYSTSLLDSGTLLQLNLSAITIAYWKGGISNVWNAQPGGVGTNTNFTSDPAGANNLNNLPGVATNVIFSASGASNQTSTVLGANIAIGSLTISDPVGVGINGANTLTLSTTSGTTGILVSGSAGASSIGANLLFSGSSNIEVDNAGGLAVSGTVGGGNGLTKLGAGLLALSASNTYSGGTTLQGGTIQIQSDSSLGASSGFLAFSGSGGTLQLSSSAGSISSSRTYNLNAPATINTNGAGNSLALSGTVTGAGSLALIGSGTLAFTGTNMTSYTGPITVTASTLQVGTGSADGSIAGSSSLTDNGAVVFTVSGTQSYANAISGTGTLTKAGAGTQILGGTNSGFSGPVSLQAGEISITANSALGTGTTTLSSNTTLDAAATLSTANALVLSSSGNSVNLQVDGAGVWTENGAMSGGNINKLGTGALVLGASNSFTGSLTMGTTSANGGTVRLGNANALPANTTLAFNGLGGTLDIDGNTVTAQLGTVSNATFNDSVGTGLLVLTNNGAGQPLNGSAGFASGTTTFNATVQLGAAGAATTLFIGNSPVSFNMTFNGSISQGAAGSAFSDYSSSGTLTFNGSNSFSGAVSLNSSGRTLAVGNNNALGAGTLALSTGDTLTASGTAAITLGSVNTVSLAAGNNTFGVAGTGNLTFTSAGAYGADSKTFIVNNANTTINGSVGAGAGMTYTKSGTGNLILNANWNVGGGVTLAVNQGNFQFGNGGTTGGYTGANLAAVTGSSGAQMVFDRSDTGLSISGTISGGLGLLQEGAGTTTISAANSFTGATTVTSGTLKATVSGALGSTSSITVNNGGTLLLSASNAANNTSATTTLGGGTLGLSASQGAGGSQSTGNTFHGFTNTGGILSGSSTGGGTPSPAPTTGLGALTLTAASTIDFKGTAETMVFNGFSDTGNYTLDIVNYANTDAITSHYASSGVDGTDDRLIFDVAGGLTTAQLDDLNFNGGQGAVEIQLGAGSNFYEVTAVPEPTTLFAGLALVGFLGLRERRRLSELYRRTKVKKG